MYISSDVFDPIHVQGAKRNSLNVGDRYTVVEKMFFFSTAITVYLGNGMR